MKLRNKVLVAISFAWIVFLTITYFELKIYFLTSFKELERHRVDLDLDRIDTSLRHYTDSMATFATDWAHWINIENYTQKNEGAFTDRNTSLAIFQSHDLNLMAIWSLDGKLIFGKKTNPQNNGLVDLPGELSQFLSEQKQFIHWADVKRTIEGYGLYNNQIWFLAASAISDNNKPTQAKGTLLVGRYLSIPLLMHFSFLTQSNLELFINPEKSTDPMVLHAYYKAAASASSHYIKPINNQDIASYTLIKDIHGQPIAMLRDVSKRYGYMMGLQAMHYYLVIYLLAAISFSLLMALLIRVLVIQRLEKLERELSIISSTHAINARVDVPGNDELSSVANQINNFMEIIQASQEHLEHSVDQRTQELKKSNELLQQEIKERKSIEHELLVNKEHLQRLAHFDNLTGLPNRVSFNEILNKALGIANRQKNMLAILFIDLDRFKNINDALGHSTGDLVLQEAARRFQSVLRISDTLARLGGDEFILLLTDIQHAKFAGQVADKILKICAEPMKIGADVFFLSASIGIAAYPSDGASLEELQKNADIAMYKAKHMGGGVFQYFTKEMNTEAYKHIQLESSLRRALEKNEFELYYQPKLDLKLGKITGVEALIRWNNPDIGLIDPIDFIPLAEETGLIMQIGEWALREACRTNTRWQTLGYEPINVAVNLSPKQFQHKDIARLVADILKESKLEAKYLDLEITETAVMENVSSAIKRLEEIKKMGVEISVDDFGMGYSSISYLKQFPVTVLKIDQSFIKGIPFKQDDMAIITAMIAMAHNLGMQVVAEGVETLEQMEYLASHNCDMIQGYFISRPLPEKKIVLQFSGGPDVSVNAT